MHCLANTCFICNSSAYVSTRVGVDLFKEEKLLKSGKKLREVVSEIIDKPLIQNGVHADVLCIKCHKIIVEYDCLLHRCNTIQAEMLENFKKTLSKFKINYDTYNSAPKTQSVEDDDCLITNWKDASISLDGGNKAISAQKSGKTAISIAGNRKMPVSNQGSRETAVSNQGIKETSVVIQGSKANESKRIVFDGKKIVLSASKLEPLPPNFVLKPGEFSSVPRSNFSVTTKLQSISSQGSSPNVSPVKPFQSKMSVDQKLVTMTDVKKDQSKQNPVKVSRAETSTARSELSSLLKFGQTPTSKDSVYTLNMTSISKEFLSAAILGEEEVKSEMSSSDGEVADENPMEIDEGCSLAVLTQDKLEDGHIFEKINEQMQVTNKDNVMRLVPAEDIVRLQIIDRKNDDDSEGHTIVMDENGTILRVVSGQKLMIGDNEISLVLPEDSEVDPLDVGDSQDSNEESQLELQVSGDEETANAIIAAAQEQGGAFIKVESGEMFRVESVQSKEESEDEVEFDFQVVKKEDGKFRCLFCEKYLNAELVFEGDASSMMQHLKETHDARLYICTVCGKFVRKKSDYVKHLSDHADSDCSSNVDKSKQHECNVCQKKFSSRVFLSEHANAHAGARPHRCTVCHKTFASKYTYASHMKTHTDRPRPYKCSQCNKTFFTQQNLWQHQKTHSGIKDFICKICNKAFGTQHNLEVHGVVHSRKKPFVCAACGKAFARRAELRDHTRIHTGERPFACEVCGARFTQRSNLYSHRRATHMDDKRYACDRCPKRFKRRRLLDYHIKASHTGERPLSCEICGTTFVYPEHYKKHVRIHSGEKPYVCEICGKTFNSRDNRNTHRFVHSDRKPYECVVCGAGYMRKQLLYRHMNTRGHLAESIVVNKPRLADSNEGAKTIEVEEDQSGEGADTTFETSEEMTTDTAEKMLGKTINISQDGETTLLTIHNIDGELETVSVDQLEQAQVVSDGSVMRLVQVQLPGGNCGWVAVE